MATVIAINLPKNFAFRDSNQIPLPNDSPMEVWQMTNPRTLRKNRGKIALV